MEVERELFHALQVSEELEKPKLNRSARLNYVLEQSNVMQQLENKAQADAVSKMKDTMRSALMREVMPALSEGLLSLVEQRPADVLEYLSSFLLRWADEKEQAHVDPYDAPIYQERIRLVSEKEEREQQRKIDKAAKIEREKAARITADDSLHELLVESIRKHESMLRS